MKKVKMKGFVLLFAGLLLASGCSQNTGKNVGGCNTGTYSKAKSQDSTNLKNGI